MSYRSKAIAAYDAGKSAGEDCTLNRSWSHSDVEAFLMSGMSPDEEEEDDDGLS